jgi:hypothetical protein
MKYMHLFILLLLFIFVAYLMTLFSDSDYRSSNGMMIGEWSIRKDVKGSGRSLIYGTIPQFT